MPVNHELIGDKIRLLRTNKNISQEKLAEMSDITREAINRIENGLKIPKTDTILAIANALDVPPTYLLDDNEGDDPLAESTVLKLLQECNHLEKQILLETLQSLKKILYSVGV